MADLLRPGDEGIVGIGPDGRPDPRVAVPQAEMQAPSDVVMTPGRQGGLPGT